MLRQSILLAACLASGIANAEIYRWVDSAGRVHFGERPPADGAERIHIQEQSRPGVVAPSESERRHRQQRMLEAFEYERAQEDAREAEAARRDAQRAAQCERLKSYWRRLSHPGPIYRTDDQGERRYLDDAERAAEKESVRPAYLKTCGEQPG